MTACRVTCDDCAGAGSPPRVSRHRRESGHTALHLAVTEAPDVPGLRRRIARAARRAGL